jgi:hypothetical protein
VNAKHIETQLLEALTEKQKTLVERVFLKRHGHTHEEYIRLNGEWWGLQDAKDEIKAVVKRADV